MTAAKARLESARVVVDPEVTAMPATDIPGIVEPIYLSKLRVAEWNARKTIEPKALAELAESIKQHGILSPLMVRVFPASSPHVPADDEKVERGELYEIVAGHRRYGAAKWLNMISAPCIVKALTDEEAQEIGIVDNLQRENIPPMEEAAELERLLARLGSIAAVAARVGKEQSYVARLLKLCSLGLSQQDALREGLITIDHAALH